MAYTLEFDRLRTDLYGKIPGDGEDIQITFQWNATFRVLKHDPATDERQIVWSLPCDDGTTYEMTEKTHLDIQQYAGQPAVRVILTTSLLFPFNLFFKDYRGVRTIGVYFPVQNIIVHETSPERLYFLSSAPVYWMPGNPFLNFHNYTAAGSPAWGPYIMYGMMFLLPLTAIFCQFGFFMSLIFLIASTLMLRLMFPRVVTSRHHVYSYTEAESLVHRIMQMIAKELKPDNTNDLFSPTSRL